MAERYSMLFSLPFQILGHASLEARRSVLLIKQIYSSIKLIPFTLMIQPRKLTHRRHPRLGKRLITPPIPTLLPFIPLPQTVNPPPSLLLLNLTDERLEY